MLTPTSKLFLPVAGVALLLGAVFKTISGDVLGGVLYLMVSVSAFLLGVLLSSIRENEYAPAYASDAPPPIVRPVAVAPLPGGGGWSVAAGIAVTLVMLGLIQHPVFTWAGVLVGMVAGAGWLARTASESTGRQIILLPLGLPVLGLTAIASVMYFLSRILLAVPEAASTSIALGVAVVILGAASFAAVRPSISGRMLAAVLAAGTVLMVAGGIFAAAVGERHIEEHHGEHAGAIELKAEGVAFQTTSLTFEADAEVMLTFDNEDRDVQHNFAIYGADPAKPIFRGQLVTGVSSVTYTFHAPGPGEYRFQCDVHPTQMKGTIKVA